MIPELRRLEHETAIALHEPASPGDIAGLLGRLTLHYWRPDFSPTQAKLMFQDFIEDLAEYPSYVIDAACRAYRNDEKRKFFPTPGQLRELCDGEMARAQMRIRGAKVAREFLERKGT